MCVGLDMDAALASEIMQGLRILVAQPVVQLRNDLCTASAGIDYIVDDIVKILTDTPFECLGAGHFSAAFMHRAYPDYAFKIGFKSEDSGALYAAWCRDNRLPHTPHIIHMDRFPECYMVCMPKYIPSAEAPDGKDDYGVAWVIEDFLEYDDSSHGTNVDVYNSYLGTELERTARAIGAFFKGVARFDMHEGNWMWDKDGNIIITDPVSFSIEQGPVGVSVCPAEGLTGLVRRTFPICGFKPNPKALRAICGFRAMQNIPRHAAISTEERHAKFFQNGGSTHLKRVQQVRSKKVPGLLAGLVARFKGV